MNEARRKQIQQALALIEQAKGLLEVVLAQEQEDFDNMPEDLRNDETGQRAEDTHDGRGHTRQGFLCRHPGGPASRLTHWSAPRRAATMQCPPARRRYRTSIADEVPARSPLVARAMVFSG